jgi:hypothetical protein
LVSGEFCDFELFFAFLLGLLFLCLLLTLMFFLHLHDLLEHFLAFWSSSCASCILDLKFKLCAFVLSMYSSRGIEKPSGQHLGLSCDE